MRHSSRKKNSTKIVVAIIAAAAVAFGFSNYLLNKKEAGAVIAKVNGEKIYKSEVERKLRNFFDDRSQEVKMPEIETLPKEVIEILVKEIYLEKELTKAAEKSAVAKDKELKDRIADLKGKILRQAYVDSLLKTEITDEKVNEKYVELTNELAGKKEYSISHIVVKTKEEAEKIAKEFKAKKPLKFADAAKKYSLDQESAEKAGDLGYILEDNMIKEIAAVLPSLKKDEISSPIETKFGWHLVKFTDVRDAKPLAFETVKNNIREQLTQDKINEINAGISKDAKVEVLLKLKETEDKKGEEQQIPEKETAAQPAESVEEVKTEEAAPAETVTEEKAVEEKAVEEKASEKTAEKTQEKTNEKPKHKKTNHKKHQR